MCAIAIADGVTFSAPFYKPNTTIFPFPEVFEVVTVRDPRGVQPEIRLQLRGVVGADVRVCPRVISCAVRTQFDMSSAVWCVMMAV